MEIPNPIPLEDIKAARERLKGKIFQTPLIRFYHEDTSAEIYLKPENLQPIGSFKLRGAGNAMALASAELLADGVYTASAGNMAQGVAWNAKELKIPCQVIVPDHAPQTKLDAIERLGASYIKLPFEEWWQVIIDHKYEGMKGLFIHPVSDPAVIAGNGTIGLEILDELPDVDAVIVPYGGGGLSSGIASAIKALKPDTKIYASEVATASPFSASLIAGEPTTVDYTASFVDGIGSKGVLPEMWPLVSSLLDDSIVVDLEQIVSSIRILMERNQMIAEGAGASSLAAALTGKAGSGKIVCVISGGNIDEVKLKAIMDNKIP
ncbi:MAG: threonine/serine dehydratase [Bacteroidetes bacterium]|nr:threonine/serine dehydratase [Bacteroidota bacterium]